MKTYALDFETYYDKTCSIRTLGPLGYFSHPQFDAYRVSVVGDDGYEYVGHPKGFDWYLLKGAIVLSHNASFDETLYLYGVEQEWWPFYKPENWYCTADMAAYCKLPRSLKGASAEAFGLDMDKSTRDNMAGKTWESMTADFKEEVDGYALKDSELCLKLWQKYKGGWPDNEKEISNLNRKIVQRGIPIDLGLLKESLEKVNLHLYDAEESIPWLGDKPLLSRLAFDDQCRLVGLEPPASLAQTDEQANQWVEYHGKKHKWIEAVRDWRRINSLQKKLYSFEYATMPDSRYYGGMMYFGAHTGRFSGSGGNLNLQNLPREEMFGANLRHLIAPKSDKKLIVVDLSQIEVRTLCWLAGDYKMLEDISKSEDIYEVFAKRFDLWGPAENFGASTFKDDNPKLRHKVKALVLGCGYGVGVSRFASMTGMSEEEARRGISIYRNHMPRVKKYWEFLNQSIKKSWVCRGDLKLSLPSGRVLNYGAIKKVKGDTSFTDNFIAAIPRNGKKVPVRLWGGLLAENLSQALARDVFAEMMTRVDKAGHKIIFHVHDELIVEAPSEEAEATYKNIVDIMSTPPEWIEDLPVAAEGSILTRYEK